MNSKSLPRFDGLGTVPAIRVAMQTSDPNTMRCLAYRQQDVDASKWQIGVNRISLGNHRPKPLDYFRFFENTIDLVSDLDPAVHEFGVHCLLGIMTGCRGNICF